MVTFEQAVHVTLGKPTEEAVRVASAYETADSLHLVDAFKTTVRTGALTVSDHYRVCNCTMGDNCIVRRDVLNNMVRLGLMEYARMMGTNVREASQILEKLVISKQYDYGAENILDYGILGVFMRANDKAARAKNLIKRGAEAMNEPLSDTYLDWAGYGVIGLMLMDETFTYPLGVENA